MFGKKRFKGRDIAIGIDETNNGFGLKPHNPHHNNSMIMTGYLGNPFNLPAGYEGSVYEAKSGIFNGKTPIEEVEERAGIFLNKNPDFFYTAVSSDSYLPITMLKANAIALLTFKFVLNKGLDPNKIQLLIDDMEGPYNSKSLGIILKEWFEKVDLDIPFRFIKHGEHNKTVIRKADRVSYYITGLHFLGKNPKWPHRIKRVDFNNLEKVAIEMLESRYPNYHPDYQP